MDEDFELFIEEFGESTSSTMASSETIEKYRGILPNRLLEYWSEFGFTGYKEGLFWIVNPAEFAGAIDSWVGDTPIVEEDNYYVIARSAFGDLYLWGQKTGYRYKIKTAIGWIIEQDGDEDMIKSGDSDFALSMFFSNLSPANVNFKDENNKELFTGAIKKLGAIEHDEAYAFEPSLIAGGKRLLSNISKVNIHVHLDILAQLGHREILDHDALLRKAYS